MQRRGKHFKKLEDLLHYGRGRLLIQLIKDCLCNAPSQRPTAEQLVTLLGGMREEDNNEIITTDRAEVVMQIMTFWRRDIERKEKHEMELTKKEDDIQQLQQQLHDTKVNVIVGMYTYDIESHFVYLQSEYEAILGQKNAEIEQTSMQLQVNTSHRP